MSRQKIRDDVRKMNKDISKFRSGRMTLQERKAMDLRIARLQKEGLIKTRRRNPFKAALRYLKLGWKRICR